MDGSENRLTVARLIMVPAVISLVVTLVRLFWIAFTLIVGALFAALALLVVGAREGQAVAAGVTPPWS